MTTFGLCRFVTGIGVGALVATVGALVPEFAEPHQRNRLNTVVYSGVPGRRMVILVNLAWFSMRSPTAPAPKAPTMTPIKA